MSTRDLLQLRSAAWLFAAVLALPSATAAAQLQCDDDAGASMCDDDAGEPMATPDAGSDAGEPVRPRADGGGVGDDAGPPGRSDAGANAACSCEADFDEDGRIHVCTESDEADVCRTFDCEIGTRRSFPCPQRPTQLCCEMRSRGLQSYLYEDCIHPNCESGFREQCRSFGGLIYAGSCENPASGRGNGDSDADDDGGVCTVSAPGTQRAPTLPWLTLTLAAALLTHRRRRS